MKPRAAITFKLTGVDRAYLSLPCPFRRPGGAGILVLVLVLVLALEVPKCLPSPS